ncbi:XcbB/CpsF family capsular polysaccharide biosynthesis protein [Mammaliicoccus vitulinus]|uniref:accessory Sec system protein Asp2 n=1 Tax=Mammaliicoccus vitulinus TaxID=71237 RepID=UPI002DC01343|nr:accessory Sec system protein Asp2 [Mammaliicoccus vitulinus]MEB7657776.1 XcbB/CpsF family capsular polysaccharide biosynthesis protein [Mammaliicoccus vitulinus]
MDVEVFKLNENIKYKDQKKIWVETNSDKNLLQLARKNNDIMSIYKELIRNDYILYLHKQGFSRFCKRESVNDLLDGLNLIKDENIYYTLDEPKGRKINNRTAKKLIVIFARMPSTDMYDNAKIPIRMFPPSFSNIERSLVKNVYIMRIMDLNCSHGSFYINTINNPNYEDEIQNAIKNVMKRIGITKTNVVLYGFSRGGSGAIYHGSLNDYKTLAVDPLLNIGGNLSSNNRRLLKGLRKEDVTPDINKYLEISNEHKKVVICSENISFYFEEIQRLNQNKIKIINMKDDKITSHSEVSPNTVPEQLMILNNLLSEVSV